LRKQQTPQQAERVRVKQQTAGAVKQHTTTQPAVLIKQTQTPTSMERKQTGSTKKQKLMMWEVPGLLIPFLSFDAVHLGYFPL
jgi:hypothetical protein